jgi:lipoprotein-releasing system ATP-binding protein
MQTLVVEQSRDPESSDQGTASRLHVSHLAKSFCAASGLVLPVLTDVSFSMAAGEMIAIMGASGAGKSTLLNIIGGLETADSGTVDFENVSDSARLKLGFVFQFHYLLSDLTTIENVSLPLRVMRVTAAEAKEHAGRLLEAVGLTDRVEDKVGSLSGGEQQRVAVARAFVTGPALVLADEPTGNLDKAIAAEIGAMLRNYAHKTPAMVLIATHNDQLAAACDRVLVLENGKVHRNEPLPNS